MSNPFFTSDDMDGLIFFQVPKVLILSENYRTMKPNALKLYIVLLDRMKLSLKNGWKDKEGRYYVRMSQDRASELFQWSPTTFRSMKKELEKYNLLYQEREGQGKSNKLYIKKCSYTEEDVYKINKVVDLEFEEEENNAKGIDEANESKKLAIAEKDKSCSSVDTVEKVKSCSSRKTKVDLLEGQELFTNNNKYNNNKDNNNNYISHSEKNDITPIVNKDVNNNQVIIDKLVLEYMNQGLSKDVCLMVVNEVLNSDEEIKNFGGYLRGALENTLYKSKMKRGLIEVNIPTNPNRPVPFYNWLEREYPDES